MDSDSPSPVGVLVGNHRELHRFGPLPRHRHRHIPPGARLDNIDELRDGGCGSPVDSENDVAGAEAVACGGRSGAHLGHEQPGHRLLNGEADGEHLGEDDQVREDDVGGDAGGDDEDAIEDGAVLEEVGVVGGDVAVGVIVGEPDEATEGEGAEGILDAASDEAGEHRAEADGELADADALECGGQEVAALVDEDDGGKDGGGLNDGLGTLDAGDGGGGAGRGMTTALPSPAAPPAPAMAGEEEGLEGGGRGVDGSEQGARGRDGTEVWTARREEEEGVS